MTRAVELAGRVWSAAKARRATWMALGAVAFGAVAVIGAHDYIGERIEAEKARLQPRHESVEVVVAKRALRRGERVGGDTMAIRALPRDVAPGGAVTPTSFDAVSGQRLAVAMRAGEPLLASSVASADTAPISSRVRPGIRAMTISVDEVNSLSGMLQPGDRIDLLLSFKPPPVAGVTLPESTRTVMQGVAVMATGRQSRASAHEDGNAGRTFTAITVEVDPEQAQRLVVAQRSGRLTAVLRNPDDAARVPERRLDVNALLGLPGPTLAAGPVAVEVIVGGRGQAPAQSSLGAPAGAPAGTAASAVAPNALSSLPSAAPERRGMPPPESTPSLSDAGPPESPHRPATVPLFR